MSFEGYGTFRCRCSSVQDLLGIDEYLGREIWDGERDLGFISGSRKLKSLKGMRPKTYLKDTAGSVPDCTNEVNIAV